MLELEQVQKLFNPSLLFPGFCSNFFLDAFRGELSSGCSKADILLLGVACCTFSWQVLVTPSSLSSCYS